VQVSETAQGKEIGWLRRRRRKSDSFSAKDVNRKKTLAKVNRHIGRKRNTDYNAVGVVK
jgi:hypothetical protein